VTTIELTVPAVSNPAAVAPVPLPPVSVIDGVALMRV
jgi:hypothetical protein